MELVQQLENSKTDSILDLGLSKYDHRQKFREFAARNNFELTLHYLDIVKDIRLKRVEKRNTEKGETFKFEVSKEEFDFMENWFEKPTEIEIKGAIYINE
jgi:predicted kinase